LLASIAEASELSEVLSDVTGTQSNYEQLLIKAALVYYNFAAQFTMFERATVHTL